MAGALLFLGGFALTGWTFAANSFASPAVRLQRDRGHRVIDTGPYTLVRHPMYAGALLLFLSMPLLLGSPRGLLALPIGAVACWRCARAGRNRCCARACPTTTTTPGGCVTASCRASGDLRA